LALPECRLPIRVGSEPDPCSATPALRLFQTVKPRHTFEPFPTFQPVEQFMAAISALITAHSDPVLDKSSIHFTRPARPREDRNPPIWKRRQQKVSRLCARRPSRAVRQRLAVRRQPRAGQFLEPQPGFGRFVVSFLEYNPSD
jgi:hypothetical protein